MDATLLPPVEAADGHKNDRTSARRPRVKLITRRERGRRWSIEQKQEIVAESLCVGTTPTEVARKHTISSGLLYRWRHQFLAGQLRPAIRPAPTFAKVGVEGSTRCGTLRCGLRNQRDTSKSLFSSVVFWI